MTIVGFTFTKMSVQKSEEPGSSKISVNHNVAFKDIELVPLSLGKEKQEAAKVSFDFTVKYEPNVGDIALSGYLVYLADEKYLKDMEKKWKKDKKVDKEVYSVLLNNVLQKCNVQAILLSKEISLPPPIPLHPRPKAKK